MVLAVTLLIAFTYKHCKKLSFPQLLPALASNITLANNERLVVVSGISSDHFEEVKDMIGSVQFFRPTTPIIIYDLGLKENQTKELEKLCNVEMRTFHFERYPPHFKQLEKYAFKATIIRLTLLAHKYEYVFWADASIRLVDNLESTLPKLEDFPLKGHHHPFKIVQVIHNGTLEYLNVTKEMMQGIIGVESGLLLFKANKITKDFLDLWYDCSMHEACIAPEGARLRPCKYDMVKPDSLEYIGCHRYDQSVLNVLLRREFGKGVFEKILDSVVNNLTVSRMPSKLYELRTCNITNN